jgi:hypothetical protein
MSAMAHHTVVALRCNADGTTRYGEGWQGDIYCTVDEIGRRTVEKELRKRFPDCEVVVALASNGDSFDAAVYTRGAIRHPRNAEERAAALSGWAQR